MRDRNRKEREDYEKIGRNSENERKEEKKLEDLRQNRYTCLKKTY